MRFVAVRIAGFQRGLRDGIETVDLRAGATDELSRNQHLTREVGGIGKRGCHAANVRTPTDSCPRPFLAAQIPVLNQYEI